MYNRIWYAKSGCVLVDVERMRSVRLPRATHCCADLTNVEYWNQGLVRLWEGMYTRGCYVLGTTACKPCPTNKSLLAGSHPPDLNEGSSQTFWKWYLIVHRLETVKNPLRQIVFTQLLPDQWALRGTAIRTSAWYHRLSYLVRQSPYHGRRKWQSLEVVASLVVLGWNRWQEVADQLRSSESLTYLVGHDDDGIVYAWDSE